MSLLLHFKNILFVFPAPRWYDAHNVKPLFPFGHGLSYTTFDYKDIVVAVSVKEEYGGSAQSSGRAYDWEYGDGGSEGVTTDTVYLPMARFNRKNIDSITTSVISRFDKLITVTATITNTGTLSGREVVQLYVTYPLSAGEPLRQLRSVRDVYLQPAESGNVTFSITSQDISIWDSGSHSWVLGCDKFNNMNELSRNSNNERVVDDENSNNENNDNDCNFSFYVGASSSDLRLKGHLVIGK